MLTALSMSLKTNLVFPQDVGPTTMPVNGYLNVRLMTTTDLCRVSASLFTAIEEEQWYNTQCHVIFYKYLQNSMFTRYVQTVHLHSE